MQRPPWRPGAAPDDLRFTASAGCCIDEALRGCHSVLDRTQRTPFGHFRLSEWVHPSVRVHHRQPRRPPMKMPLILASTFVLTACAPPSGAVMESAPLPAPVGPSSAAAEPAGHPYVLPPGGGERMDYCARPLTLWMKVDSVPAPGTRMIAGTVELRGDEGQGRHPDADEVVYIIRGSGHAVFGNDTIPLRPGSVAYVPQGVAHQLVSTGAEPMEYLFVIGPRTSAASFRRAAERGCPAQPQ